MHGVRERSTEEENVGLWLVLGIVNPTGTLLDTKSSPFIFAEQLILGQYVRNIAREDDVTFKSEIEGRGWRGIEFKWKLGGKMTKEPSNEGNQHGTIKEGREEKGTAAHRYSKVSS